MRNFIALAIASTLIFGCQKKEDDPQKKLGEMAGKMGDALKGAQEKLGALAGDSKDGLTSLMQNFLQKFDGAALMEKSKSMTGSAKDALVEKLNALTSQKTVVTDLLSKMTSGGEGAWSGLKGQALGALAKLQSTFESAKSAAGM